MRPTGAGDYESLERYGIAGKGHNVGSAINST